MPVISVSARALAMVAPFMAVRDVRPYLNGIGLVRINERPFVVGCDGSTLIIVHDPDAVFPDLSRGLGIDFGADMMKLAHKNRKGGARVEIEAFESVSPDGVPEHITTAKLGGVAMPAQVYNMYPDVTTVIPDLSGGDYPFDGFLNADFMARLAQVHKIAGAPYNGVSFRTKTPEYASAVKGAGQAAVAICPNLPDALAIIMPVRMDEGGYRGHMAYSIYAQPAELAAA
jgi:hypothetical protein